MEVREARRKDLPAIVEMLADDDLGQHREDAGNSLRDRYAAAFNAIDRDPNNLLVVADDGGELVATLQLTFIPHLTFRGGWRAQVEAVRVSRHRRGEGLGRRLLQWAIEEAKQRGCHLVQLTTNKERAEARRFYESLGFHATHDGMKLNLSPPEA